MTLTFQPFKLTALVLMLILISGATAAQEATDTPWSLLWEQVGAQPDDFAVGCIPLDAPTRAVLYNAYEPFPLASVSKLLIFIEYARRIDSGALSFTEMVDVAMLDRYNLPRTDRGAHDRFMAQYSPTITAIPLWELAVGMIQYSSNAASDYLLDRLAPIDWQPLLNALNVRASQPPHSLTMIPLLMNNHETGRASLNDLDSLSIPLGEDYLERYINDEAWREAEIAYRSQRGSQFPTWSVQTAILERLTARGTVSDFLNVLTAIYGTGDALNDNVKTLVRIALRWDDNTFINQNYVEYGSKLGFYSGGTLALVAYGSPINGSPVISAAFFRAIPRRTYLDLLEGDAIGDLAHWMNFNGCGGLNDAINEAVN